MSELHLELVWEAQANLAMHLNSLQISLRLAANCAEQLRLITLGALAADAAALPFAAPDDAGIAGCPEGQSESVPAEAGQPSCPNLREPQISERSRRDAAELAGDSWTETDSKDSNGQDGKEASHV